MNIYKNKKGDFLAEITFFVTFSLLFMANYLLILGRLAAATD